MSDKTDQAIATLGDVHVVGQGRPVTGPQLRYAVTVQRPSPFSGLLEQIPVSRGMGLHAGDVLTSRAFVSGLDVVFGDGVEELVGRGLMAHEVAHVIQQRSGRVTPMNNAAVQGQNGGESEGVAIARALVNAPPLILADEPTGSLDTATSQEIMELFKTLNQEGQTIVMVTHNSENRPYFDRTVTLRDGELAEDSQTSFQVIARAG